MAHGFYNKTMPTFGSDEHRLMVMSEMIDVLAAVAVEVFHGDAELLHERLSPDARTTLGQWEALRRYDETGVGPVTIRDLRAEAQDDWPAPRPRVDAAELTKMLHDLARQLPGVAQTGGYQFESPTRSHVDVRFEDGSVFEIAVHQIVYPPVKWGETGQVPT